MINNEQIEQVTESINSIVKSLNELAKEDSTIEGVKKMNKALKNTIGGMLYTSDAKKVFKRDYERVKYESTRLGSNQKYWKLFKENCMLSDYLLLLYISERTRDMAGTFEIADAIEKNGVLREGYINNIYMLVSDLSIAQIQNANRVDLSLSSGETEEEKKQIEKIIKGLEVNKEIEPGSDE